MTRVDEYREALTIAAHEQVLGEREGETQDLLFAIAEAWSQAESQPISENEAQRWSRVCSAAEKVVGL